MQYGSRNYIMTILKTQFLGKTLHHVKKRILSEGFTQTSGIYLVNIGSCKYRELMSFDMESYNASIDDLALEPTIFLRLDTEI